MAKNVLAGAAFVLVAVVAGCGKDAAQNPGAETKEAAKGKAGEAPHSGWWCDEHGVPEADCSMCSPKVAKAYKEKGDWCQEHDRAESQCFICNPKRAAKFAADYRAKYGKEPPEAKDNTREKK